jgi:ADP-ribose pyrophosphatase YjhB (NUDIX family)
MDETINNAAIRRARVSVGAVVRHFDGVLLVKRRDEAGEAETWCLPRAEQRWGETLQQAVARAVREQAGVQVAAGDIVQVYDEIDPQADEHVVMMDFEARYLTGEAAAGEGVLDVAWATGLALISMQVEENTAELLAYMGVI